MAVSAYRLHHLTHPDPGGRLLIAICIEQRCPLVTYDTPIEQCAVAHGSQYGLSARN